MFAQNLTVIIGFGEEITDMALRLFLLPHQLEKSSDFPKESCSRRAAQQAAHSG